MTEATGPLSSHASVGQPGMFFFSCSRSIITEVPFHICTCVRSTNLPLAKASHVAKPWEMQTHLAKWHWYRAGDELVPLMQLIYPDSLSHYHILKEKRLRISAGLYCRGKEIIFLGPPGDPEVCGGNITGLEPEFRFFHSSVILVNSLQLRKLHLLKGVNITCPTALWRSSLMIRPQIMLRLVSAQ